MHPCRGFRPPASPGLRLSQAGLRPKRFISSGLPPEAGVAHGRGAPLTHLPARRPQPRPLTLPGSELPALGKPPAAREPASACGWLCGPGWLWKGRPHLAGPTWLAARSPRLPPPRQEPSGGPGTQQASGRGWPGTWREGRGRADVQRSGQAPWRPHQGGWDPEGCQRASCDGTHPCPGSPKALDCPPGAPLPVPLVLPLPLPPKGRGSAARAAGGGRL